MSKLYGNYTEVVNQGKNTALLVAAAFFLVFASQASVEQIFSYILYLDYLLVTPILERIVLESIYFIPSFIVALIFLYVTKNGMSLRRFNAAFLTSRIWSSRSAKADYVSIVVNSVILGMITLILESLLTGGAVNISRSISLWMASTVGAIEPVSFPILASIGATFAVYVFLDFYFYWYHRWLHSGGFAWKLHSRHHSATILTPFSNFRGHPIEAVLRAPLIFGISVTVAGLADYFSGGQASEIALLGTNLFGFIVLFFAGTLTHTHIFLRFPRWLSHLIVSPAMHQVHHSNLPKHHNKNFASAFALWDWLFGTLYLPSKGEKIKFGLGDVGEEQHNACEFMLGKGFSNWLKQLKQG